MIHFNKIKIYLLIQILKYFFLILFIFLSVAWILQITRLFTITNFLQIEILDILLLSIYLIPNIITIIIPFILIFGLLLCFVKLKKDNELIAILSLGFGVQPLKSSLIYFSTFIIIVFTFLNFYFSPKIYEIYKNQEFELRNTLNFDKILFSNFLNLNNKTILDFNKKNNEYKDIFISFIDEKDNLVYAKKGNIYNNKNGYNFQLQDGFKISISKNKEIEKLEFLNYILKIDSNNIISGNNIDKNTYTIFDDFKSKNFLNISFKIFDIVIILYIISFFYINNLRDINLNTKNNIYFTLSSIFILIINQIIKNSEISLLNYSTFIISIIILSFLISNIKKKYE